MGSCADIRSGRWLSQRTSLPSSRPVPTRSPRSGKTRPKLSSRRKMKPSLRACKGEPQVGTSLMVVNKISQTTSPSKIIAKPSSSPCRCLSPNGCLPSLRLFSTQPPHPLLPLRLTLAHLRWTRSWRHSRPSTSCACSEWSETGTLTPAHHQSPRPSCPLSCICVRPMTLSLLSRKLRSCLT